MIPSPDHFPGGSNSGEPPGGGPRGLPPTTPRNFDDELTRELASFHSELCPVVKKWITKKPSLDAVEKLVALSERLFGVIYSRYRDGGKAGTGSVITLKDLGDKVRVAAFGLNEMHDAGGRISSEERLKLHDDLLKLDSALGLVLKISDH